MVKTQQEVTYTAIQWVLRCSDRCSPSWEVLSIQMFGGMLQAAPALGQDCPPLAGSAAPPGPEQRICSSIPACDRVNVQSPSRYAEMP